MKLSRNLIFWLIAILIVTVVSVFFATPDEPEINIFGWNPSDMEIQLGLDLQGGSQLVFQANLADIKEESVASAKESLLEVIRNRVDILGVREPNIQASSVGDSYAVIVELPGITDTDTAVGLIGETAQLKFLEQDKKGKQFKETKLTGAHLKQADVDVQQGSPVISLKFDKEGAELFEKITERNINEPVAISLDNRIISAPTVNDVIKDGQAVIQGDFTPEEAKLLKNKLNAGALPVPLELVEQRTIGPTLGEDILKGTILAGLIGMILLIIFMVSYYQFAGVVASIALLIYSAIALTIYKMIPVTMSLAGIAGFILSIGMAVDANILIFERSREEIAKGKPLISAVEDGFRRAWPSIRDSNISSILTAIILFYFGSGLIKGFALTLGIGILISMFTAITVSRNFWLLILNLKKQANSNN
jgi:protein-export SecD/SecF family membrane protein